MDRRMGGLQSHCGCGGEEKNSQPLSRPEPLIIQPVAHCYTTELTWFLYLILIQLKCFSLDGCSYMLYS
jgi:hypothetical protein